MLWWAAVLVFGVLGGAGLVGFLVLPRPGNRLIGLAGAVAVASGATAAIRLGVAYESSFVSVVGFLATLASFVGGYWLVSALLPSLVTDVPVEPLSPSSAEDDRFAVVAVACAEPERYRPRHSLRDVSALEDVADTHVPDNALPVLLATERARYHAAGGSPARTTVRQLLDAMQARLPEDRFQPPIAAWCAGEPFPDQAVARLAAAGAKRVLVVPVSIAPSVSMARALDRLSGMRTESAGVRLIDVPYMGDLAPLDEHLADLVAARVPEDMRERAGVALVGTGQPHEWDRQYPEGPDEETAFMQRVRLALTERGFQGERIRLAWSEWRQPDVPDAVRHLVALGCRRVTVVAACAPFPGLNTLLDLPQAVRTARTDESTTVDLLVGWSDEALAAMMADALVRTAEEWEREEP